MKFLLDAIMRFLVITLLVCFLCLGCKNNSSDTKKEGILKNEILGENNNFSLKFITVKDDVFLKTIEVYNNKNLFQTIEVYNNKEIDQTIMTTEILRINDYGFKDWNFDGYNDISIQVDCGATGNCTYWVWDYDPNSNTFILNENISGYMGWKLDTKSKQLINHYREGANHELFRYYIYNNQKLKQLKAVDKQIYNYNSVLWKVTTTENLENNKVIRTRDSIKIN